MTKYLKILFFIAIILSGCKKAPINDKIEGHWLIEEIKIKETQETLFPEGLFYSIGRFVTEVKEKRGSCGYGAYVCETEYSHDKDSISFKNFIVRDGYSDEGVRANSEQLKPFGIINPNITSFYIIKSSTKELIIESDWSRINLIKF